MSGEPKSSWQHRSEFYEKRCSVLTKELLKIRNRINSLGLESGWDKEGGSSSTET